MKKERSGAGAMLTKTKSFGAGAEAIFVKRKSSGAGKVLFSQRLCSSAFYCCSFVDETKLFLGIVATS